MMELKTMTQVVLENSKMRDERHKVNKYETVTQYLFDTLPVFLYAKFISLEINEETIIYFDNVSVLDFVKYKMIKVSNGHPVLFKNKMTIEDLINSEHFSTIILNDIGIDKLGCEI